MAEIITIILIGATLVLLFVGAKAETKYMLKAHDLGRVPPRKGLIADVKLKKNTMKMEPFLPSSIKVERYIFAFITLAFILLVVLVTIGQAQHIDSTARLETRMAINERNDHVDCERISRLEEILNVDPLDCGQIYASVTDGSD